ncbi:Gfo/Idh/MocA family protein [Saccharothrix deserti]|uniref:Gfo/Idh/MocA family protein n=1 Tax=Saccharothrix deserti TaxID=2593674 RepID=UPI00131ADD65|nr:Gfo/Idh/MocA family oxidoreductase [Saccharothrix deserti]
MPTERPLRLGLLGCADIAIRRVLPTAATLPDVDLVAVASRDLAKAESAARPYGADPVAGYRALLDRDDVDAVYVPLPSGLHAPWVRRALRAGKHVLAEKPLTTSLADTVALVEQARSANLVLRENFMFVHHGLHHHVRRLLDDGVIGTVRWLSAAFAIPTRPADDIRHRPELGGGALFDVGAYPVRVAQFLLGGDLDVVGATLRHDPVYGVDLSGAVLLQRPKDGVSAQLAFGLEHRYTSTYQLVGTTGTLTVEHAFTPPAHHRPVLRIERQDHREEHVLAADDQCRNALAAFARAVREGPLVDESIVLQAELVERAHRAASGQPSSAR